MVHTLCCYQALTKLGARVTDLALRVQLCLSKIINHRGPPLHQSVVNRAIESLNLLRLSSVAYALFEQPCGQLSHHKGVYWGDDLDARMSLPFLLEQPTSWYVGRQQMHAFSLQ